MTDNSGQVNTFHPPLSERQPRNINLVKRPFAPSELVWQVVRQNAALKDQREAVERRELDLLIKVADEAFTHRKVLRALNDPGLLAGRWLKDVELLSRRLDDILRERGVSYDDLSGRELTDEILDMADVQGCLTGDVEKEKVFETVYPPVFLQGRLVRRGAVVAVAPAR